MYKLLVVDDEYNIRDGIVNAVPWEICDVVVVGEACNGVEALRKVEETLPDIVITDINMEDMDGLEFTDHLKQKYPHIKVIILSGYDEFDYAKRALQLKVFSYLLKPILPDELIKVMKEVINEIQVEEQVKERIINLESEIKLNREVLLERLLNDLVNGNIYKRSEFEKRLSLVDLHMDKRFYSCLIFDLDGYYDLTEAFGIERVQIMLQCIKEIINDIFLKEYGVWSFIDSSGNIICIFGGEPEGNGRNLKNIHANIERLKQAIRNTMKVTITVTIGGLYRDILDISKSFTEAMKALDFKAVTGKDCIIHIDDVNSISGGRFSYPKDKENAILSSFNEEDDLKIRFSIEAFFKDIGSRSYMKEHMRISIMELFAVIARKFMDLGVDIHKIYERDLVDLYKIIDRFDTVEEVKNWLTNIVIGCVKELRCERFSNIKSVVKKAQEYIEINFTSPYISLNSIADHIYLNPTYFSKLYKKETGETYLEFLTRLRIEKAKKLLKETNIRTGDIGTAVGYPNSQYFTTLFKKVIGKTPVEYREKNSYE
jgi:two-component system, response regulator YesN